MIATTANCRPNYETDGSAVWIALGPQCVARFGAYAWEVHHPVETGRGAAGKVAGLADWAIFTTTVKDMLGLSVPQFVTPRCFADALGLPAHYSELPVLKYNPDDLFLLPVADLANKFSPYQTDVWSRDTVTTATVQQYLNTGETISEFVDHEARGHLVGHWDSKRIAYFVRNPWSDPIAVDIFDPETADYNLRDGFHRLGAAIFRGDPHILSELGGYIAPELRLAAFPGMVPFSAATAIGRPDFRTAAPGATCSTDNPI